MRPLFKLLNVSITFDLITLHVDRKNFGNIDFPPDVAPYCFWYLSTKIPLLYILLAFDIGSNTFAVAAAIMF